MNEVKKEAVAVLNELHRTIPYSDYWTIHDGLEDIETLKDRDIELEELWERFADIPMNPETECIEEPFMGWGVGIHREEIWHWFDERHSKGVAYLLYGEAANGESKREKCFIVMHRNYAEGTDACAYRTEEDARKAVEEEAEAVAESLFQEGREPKVSRDAFQCTTIYVGGSDIYYEWEIIETYIE